MTTCRHCEGEIVPPLPGSYPPNVHWVHVKSDVGAQNRHCGPRFGTVAQPAPVQAGQ